ncbi:MAG TPA: hypothetical protein VFO38_04335 [Candidatus Saccharimonadales bacterium]|nr:hypothetical protein [Candidatus Saccharimonadales bacterium]
MEFRGGQSNNTPVSKPQPSSANFAANGGNVHKENSNKPLLLGIIAAVAIIVIGGIGWFAWQKMSSGGASINSNQYQALFLTNGQVYFGKLSNVNDHYVKLTDIYYLQVQQSVQPADKKQTAEQPQVSLAKLGSELHAPEDAMMVNRDQVLFFENLKDDGKVVTAIRDNKK